MEIKTHLNYLKIHFEEKKGISGKELLKCIWCLMGSSTNETKKPKKRLKNSTFGVEYFFFNYPWANDFLFLEV